MKPKFEEIPKLFWSDLTGAKMDTCVSCEKKLIVEGALYPEPYLIEKAVRSYKGGAKSTIFEYAMCIECMETMRNVLSKDSRARVDAYFQENVDMEARRKYLMENEDAPLDEYIGHCLVSGQAAEDVEEYQLFGQCMGDKLIKVDFPYMISGSIIDEMTDLLSAETLGELDDFKRSITDPSPEFMELLDNPRMLV